MRDLGDINFMLHVLNVTPANPMFKRKVVEVGFNVQKHRFHFSPHTEELFRL